MALEPDNEKSLLLTQGEVILWRGAPKGGLWLEPTDVFFIPFSILWAFTACVPLILLITGNLESVEPIAYVILPIFATIGLYMMVGRFFVAKAARKRTHYYLTNQRAVIRDGLFKRRERSVFLGAVAEIRISRSRDGHGTIEFGQASPFYNMMPRSFAAGQSSLLAPAFERIASPDLTYQMALQVQRGSLGSQTNPAT